MYLDMGKPLIFFTLSWKENCYRVHNWTKDQGLGDKEKVSIPASFYLAPDRLVVNKKMDQACGESSPWSQLAHVDKNRPRIWGWNLIQHFTEASSITSVWHCSGHAETGWGLL